MSAGSDGVRAEIARRLAEGDEQELLNRILSAPADSESDSQSDARDGS